MFEILAIINSMESDAMKNVSLIGLMDIYKYY
jgi:hypothetical protein